MIDEADLDTLYAAPLARFVEVRKEIATRLRKQGRKDAATEVAAVSKPTPAAWAVNQLWREARRDVELLVPLGAKLRAAMRAGVTQGAEGRKRVLAREREQREAIAVLVKKARELLEASGSPSSAAVIERVETTLTTFSTTGGFRGDKAGHLSKELDPPTVEEVAALLMASAEDAALEETETGPKEAPAETPPAIDEEAEKRRLVDEAKAALAAAEAASEGARRQRDDARSAVEEARAAIEAAGAEERARAAAVAVAERALAEARERLAEARSAFGVAERGLAASESALNRAEGERDRAARRVAAVSKT